MQQTNVVYLPGASEEYNREWVDRLARSFSDFFAHSYVQHYSHWEDGGDLDIALELKTLAESISDMETYGVIAKSAGSLVALRGMYEGQLQPSYLVCMGFPLAVVHSGDLPIARWLTHTDVPIVVIQNSDDPIGSFDEVSTWINKHNKRVVFVPLPGETHTYDDFAAIEEVVRRISEQLL